MRLGLLLLLASLGLGACAQPPAVRTPPAFYVPTTALVNNPRAADRVLVGPADGVFAWRAPKEVAGSIPIAGTTTFTTYTVDAQNISLPDGVGYRYRWVVQTGLSAPPVP